MKTLHWRKFSGIDFDTIRENIVSWYDTYNNRIEIVNIQEDIRLYFIIVWYYEISSN